MVPSQDRQATNAHIEATDPSFEGFDLGPMLPEPHIEIGTGACIQQVSPDDTPVVFEKQHDQVDGIVTDMVTIDQHNASTEEITQAHLVHSYRTVCRALQVKPGQSVAVVRNDGRSGRVFCTEIDGRYALYAKTIGATHATELRGATLYEALGRLGFDGDELAKRVRVGARLLDLHAPRPLMSTLGRVIPRKMPERKAIRQPRRSHHESPVRLPIG